MSEDWQAARLIPTSGISGADEAERRATSALLAVMQSVNEYGRTLTRSIGAPTGHLTTYIEVPFDHGDRKVAPDGLLRVIRGSRSWTALVEVKTGNNELSPDQVNCYLDVARMNDFDAVLTVSNQIAPGPGMHPVPVDRRKLRRVALHHISWAEILTVAVQQRVHRGVSDTDQAWILGELIRYLEHPKSGAFDFSDMGTSWVAIRNAVTSGTLRSTDKGITETVARWEQLLRFIALRLGRELGADVQVQLSRKESADPSIRFAGQAASLVSTGTMSGSIRIPDTAAPLEITCDIRSSQIAMAAHLDAPRTGRPTTRINWLTRQLRDAPDSTRIDAYPTGSRVSTSELLGVVRENPTVLVDLRGRELRSFRVTALSPMGPKRGTGRGAFIDSVIAGVDTFYGTVLQNLRGWTPKAPRLPKPDQHMDTIAPATTPPPDRTPDEATTPVTSNVSAHEPSSSG